MLKVQYNVVKDENIRLKTKLQFSSQEMLRKDKEIEALSMKLQQVITARSAGQVMANTNVFESFLTSQLKRQVRELKNDCTEKERLVEELKRNIKLSRVAEVEAEVQAYVEECLRLRQMLEGTMAGEAPGAAQGQQQQ